jgi:RimJ/RimL family protein N-acetyltransferase
MWDRRCEDQATKLPGWSGGKAWWCWRRRVARSGRSGKTISRSTPRSMSIRSSPGSLGGPLSSQDPDGIAEWAQELFDREGIGLLAVERREDGVFMGMCGLHHFHAYPDEIEIGFRFARSYWGHGYCTEAATAWLDHGFRSSLGLPRVISIADREDPRSLAVMRRLGMSLDHEAELEDGGERFQAVIYSISSEAWLARTC